MPSKLIVGCLLLVALVSGCASGPVQHTATSGWFNPSTGVFVFPLADGSLNIELWEVRNYQPFELTNNSADPTLWLTEDRRAVCLFYACLFPGLGPKASVDIGFATQEACERFRSGHPTYTTPHEVCTLRHYRITEVTLDA